ncbi:glycoside hydrolase family 97 protein [Marinilabilia sp.]|uniref:glycoside hydrolase family 97 protein n=1 Tax=Marinilabilia sp. TaxID=2021252 RepID=UPI0025B8E369|nr:glycoside hydrolase family 97 protein [Marinilabilia sp.]
MNRKNQYVLRGFFYKVLITLALILAFMVSGCDSATKSSFEITSPDGRVSLNFGLKNDSAFYSVFRQGNKVIEDSKLGFILDEVDDLASGFTIKEFNTTSFSETWEQPWGEKREILNEYNELVVNLSEREGLKRRLDIIFRVFDDGVAFRYVFPEQEHLKEFRIMDEITEFSLTDNHEVWSQPAYRPDRYEYLYSRKRLNEVADTMHTPLTLETGEDLYLSVHEAALTDYAAMTLFLKEGNRLECDLVPWSDGVKVYAETPFSTPWRTIQIAEKPGDLITSYMILNLNELNRVEDVSWIKPAKYVGIWWEMHINKSTWGQGPNHGATTENVKKYIDFASENNLGGVLVEGWNLGWDSDWWNDGNGFNFTTPYPDFDIKEVTDYAASKGVELIGHHETGGAVDNYEAQMEEAYAFYEKHGVNYIKTGYVNPRGMNGKEWHHSQFGVRHYRKAVETAARHHIMLDVHEPIKATGIRRTYPNMMTREGSRGMEFNAWGADGGNPPEHETILPFTRLLGGPMDFTPGIFNISIPENPNNQVNTTLAKQLALYVVIYSPLQMAADLPENYLNQPAFQFIREVPVDWEDTRVLNGEIGEYITIARQDRNSEDWFLGSISDEEERTLTISLDFLEPGHKYNAVIYRDDTQAHYKNNPLDILIEEREVTSDMSLTLQLASGGGQAVHFSKLE